MSTAALTRALSSSVAAAAATLPAVATAAATAAAWPAVPAFDDEDGELGELDGVVGEAVGDLLVVAGVVVLVVVVLLVVGTVVAALAISRALRRRRERRTLGVPTADRAAVPPRAGRPGTASAATAELAARASQALVATDDAVRESAQELSFARAQFGDAAVTGFEQALADARTALDRAFAAQHQLDAAAGELPEHQRRALLEEVLRHCRTADEALESQAEAMDRLRDLERSLPALLPQVERRHQAATSRLAAAQAATATLVATYAPSATREVADDPEQASALLVGAGHRLAEARERLAAGAAGEAAMATRQAEADVAEATAVLDGIDVLARDLDAATRELPPAVADLRADVAEATAVLARGGSDDLAGATARAEAAIAEAERATGAPGGDPLGTLRRLEAADATLTQVLAAGRESGRRLERTRTALEHSLVAARADVRTVEDFVASHRAAVGGGTRSQVAAARRELDAAERLAGDDPEAALAAAGRAEATAEAALAAAQAEVRRYRDGDDDYQGPYGRPPGSGTAQDLAVTAAGILIGSVLGSGRRGRGGFKLGGFGGGFGGLPGGFGGSGGGRF